MGAIIESSSFMSKIVIFQAASKILSLYAPWNNDKIEGFPFSYHRLLSFPPAKAQGRKVFFSVSFVALCELKGLG